MAQFDVVNKGFKTTGVLACFLAVLLMSGSQWVVLQSFAWVRMAVHFYQQDTLREAIAKTLSGRYPCTLCRTVQSGLQQQKQEEQKLPWLQTQKMPEAVWEWRCLSVPEAPIIAMGEPAFIPLLCSEFSESPPTPPPRA